MSKFAFEGRDSIPDGPISTLRSEREFYGANSATHPAKVYDQFNFLVSGAPPINLATSAMGQAN
jgi:hypothetical protein